MSERENILGRIREALRVPYRAAAHGGVSAHVHAQGSTREWLPRVPEKEAERFEMFARNAADLKASFHLLEGANDAEAVLRTLAQTEKWSRVAAHRGTIAGSLAEKLGLPVLFTDSGFDPNELEKCPVGITECDALVAQTGSVLVTSRSAGGRSLSVLPEHHVVIARRSQMVPDLPSAFQLLRTTYGAGLPSFISFISGPSRTGDIERILVLGAHGPKRLTIICW